MTTVNDMASAAEAESRPLPRGWLAFELVAVFAGLPAVFWLGWVPLHVLSMLWLFAAFALFLLLRDHDFDRRRLFSMGRAKPFVRPMLRRFLVLGGALALVTVLLAPHDVLFGFVRQRPLLWALVMALYPLLSVWPQGVVYRVFFFHRYRRLFPSLHALVAASALFFAWSHVVFDNWVALALTLPGGWLFASTYRHSHSSLVAWLEHSLYGCLVITLGLGRYLFYQG